MINGRESMGTVRSRVNLRSMLLILGFGLTFFPLSFCERRGVVIIVRLF